MSRQSNLVGNVLNVNTGDWVRRESGVYSPSVRVGAPVSVQYLAARCLFIYDIYLTVQCTHCNYLNMLLFNIDLRLNKVIFLYQN